MDFLTWVKKNGLTALLIAAVIGIYTFVIRAEIIHDNYGEIIKELKEDMKNMPKRIIDEINYQKFLRQMADEGIEKDTINN
jgi:hypothetical protein